MPTTSGEPRAAGRCVTGARHQREGRPCQDAFRHARRAGCVALAVADGHGSSKNGGEGAALAAEVAVEFLLEFYEALDPARRLRPAAVHELLREPVSRKIVQQWAHRVRAAAGERPPEQDVLREHGTTLLATLVAPEFVLFLQLGDGDILAVQQDGSVLRGVERNPRNFADETDSLCSPRAWLAMQLAVWPPFPGEALILLATDGYANSYETAQAFEQVGPDYLARVRAQGLAGVAGDLEAILEQTSNLGSGDDITLGLIHIPPSAGGAGSEEAVDAG